MAIANALAFILYLGCSAYFIRQFVQQPTHRPAYALPISILMLLALVFHALDLSMSLRIDGQWHLGLMNSLSAMAWLMAVIAFVSGLKQPKAHPGIVILPLVALILILKVELPTAPLMRPANPALEWHILLSLAAYSLFTLAAIQAVVIAVQERQLKHRSLGRFTQQLPALQDMERSLFQMIAIGFGLLTLSLITGAVFVDNFLGQKLAHKTVFSLLAWMVFASLLFGRWRYGWRGKTAMRWTVSGFTLLLLAYVGSKIVIEFILN